MKETSIRFGRRNEKETTESVRIGVGVLIDLLGQGRSSVGFELGLGFGLVLQESQGP